MCIYIVFIVLYVSFGVVYIAYQSIINIQIYFYFTLKYYLCNMCNDDIYKNNKLKCSICNGLLHF